MQGETHRETLDGEASPSISDVLSQLSAAISAAAQTLASRRLQPWAAFATLCVLNLLYRLPHFLNANGVHSDAAIVGLQAMHMLRGEVERFLWGAGYQGSFDAMVVAAFFAVFGRTSLALMAAPFTGHLILCACVYAVLLQRLKAPWLAALVCLPLVFTPQAINGVVLYAPRQWCVTLLFIGFWLFEGGEHLRPLRFFAGAFVACLATFLDLFGTVMLVPLLVGLVLCAFDAPRRPRLIWLRLAAGLAGTVAGFAVVQWLRAAPGATGSQTNLLFTFNQVRRNWPLFSEACLPWVIGAKIPGHDGVPLLQWIGGGSLLAFIAAAPFFLGSHRVGWRVKRLGVIGALGAAAAIGGFLVSLMPVDHYAARYLAPVVWFAPLALAPWAAAQPTRRFIGLITPYLVCAAVGGWLSYGSFVDGPLPRRDARGTAAEEMKVADALRARGIKVAFANYWLAYRLTFLWHEDPVVIPFDWEWDRHPQYRAQLGSERTQAYIFHTSEPRVKPADILPTLTGKIETDYIEGYTIITHHRAVRRRR